MEYKGCSKERPININRIEKLAMQEKVKYDEYWPEHELLDLLIPLVSNQCDQDSVERFIENDGIFTCLDYLTNSRGSTQKLAAHCIGAFCSCDRILAQEFFDTGVTHTLKYLLDNG
jgi:hypothetical protein